MTYILTDLKKKFKSKKFCKICGHDSLINVQPVLRVYYGLYSPPPKKSGHCRKVAISGVSTVYAATN